MCARLTLRVHNRGSSRSGVATVAALWLVACAAAGLCLLLGTPPAHVGSRAPQAVLLPSAGPSPAGISGARFCPIEAVRVGQRVVSGAGTAAESTPTTVDPASWKLLKLRAVNRWPDGTIDDTEVQTLQPPAWIAEHHARVGALVPIPVDLRETGLPDGAAEVVAVEPCPPIRDGPGRVVLTAVNHLNNFCFRLTLRDAAGRTDTIEPTGWHKFLSRDRGWVCASQVTAGEQLLGLGGTLTVLNLVPEPGVRRVYNLTVEGSHIYCVGEFAALAHNTSAPPNPGDRVPRATSGSQPVEPDPAAEGTAHTRIGTEPGDPQGRYPHGPYRQGYTFDENGNLIGRTDVTDHGRPWNHDVPHFHPWQGPNGGWGPPQPIP